jgi:hypothetical protein
MHYLRHKKGNLKKNSLGKIESLCHADSKHIFRYKIVPVPFERKHILSWRFLN